MNSGLTSVTIGNGVTSIGDEAFRGNGLTSVDIPDSVTNIGDGAFARNNGLASIDVSSSSQNFSSREGVLYNKAGTALLAWPREKTPVSIPDGVTSIGDAAFDHNYINSITIGTDVNIWNGRSMGYGGGWVLYALQQ